ncbi:glycogen synthase GlgA [Atopobium minutum]|uniref:glycogen synthase GlgA n=1 Tax=Atopobium minutum TaxID=1381 RepID=UPI00280AF859|nr:glycogen synthase GlgA [Atopobium minutum]
MPKNITRRVRRKLRVLFASSEVAPFSKTGGLGDVAGALPLALREAGCKVAVISPNYASIPEQFKSKMKHLGDFYVPLSWRRVYCGIEHLVYRGIDYYFVDNEYYFARDGLYGYFDDGERFAFFAKAIVEAISQIEQLRCDILHCNDWQTALSPVFLREFYSGEIYNNVKTVFTVHNVKFQGQYSDDVLGDILGLHEVPAAVDQLHCDEQSINFMKGALRYSDWVTTVSPTYANELKDPYFGEQLEFEFQRSVDSFQGVLNGIDTTLYDPATDACLQKNYSVTNLAGKQVCKTALQKELGFEEDPDRLIVGFVGRLTEQKGLDLIQYGVDNMMSRNIQMVVLGTGDATYENSMAYFDWRYHDQFRAKLCFDADLAQRIYAGSDLFLMPSRFEPCGLSQMISMRYGTLPVVHEVGGLVDSVQSYNRFTHEGTGFSFAHFNADEMLDAVYTAAEIFWTQQKEWHDIQKQAMSVDFGWHCAADDYVDLYHQLHPEVDRYLKKKSGN